MSTFLTFIKCIPELLGLIVSIKAAIEKAELEGKIQDHIKAVSDAFQSGDSSKLDALFNSSVPDPAGGGTNSLDVH